MRSNANASAVSCHRVVKSEGKIVGYLGKNFEVEINKKIALLRDEGIGVASGTINDFEEVLCR